MDSRLKVMLQGFGMLITLQIILALLSVHVFHRADTFVEQFFQWYNILSWVIMAIFPFTWPAYKARSARKNEEIMRRAHQQAEEFNKLVAQERIATQPKKHHKKK